MKAWVVDDDEGLFFFAAETRGQARQQFRQETWDGYHYLDVPPTRRCPAMDGLEVSELNAFRMGIIGRAECAFCGTMISWSESHQSGRLVSYGAHDEERIAVTDGESLWCSEACHQHYMQNLVGSAPDG